MRPRSLSATAALTVLALGGTLLSLGQPSVLVPARAQDKAQGKAADPRDEDRAAIRGQMRTFVAAFESGDARAVAGNWTAEGEYVGEDGATIRGREELEKSFAAFFAKNPKVRAEARAESVRFLSRDSAIEEGTVTIRKESSSGPVAARYEALLVREDGRWRFARLTEETVEGSSVEELAWLVGDWKSMAGQDAEVTTTYAWNEGKTFLKVHFTIKGKDRAFSGDQFLGEDPVSGQIRAWTFESAGGVGEGTWTRDGDRWVVDMAATTAGGETLTSTNILTRVNDDLFTWQSIDRLLGDESLPDLPPVKVSRIKAKK